MRSSGKNDDVIATPGVKSASLRREMAPTIDSLLVRERTPRRLDSRGSRPSSFIRCSSFWVLYVPAAITTWSAVKVCRRPTGPVRVVSTS